MSDNLIQSVRLPGEALQRLLDRLDAEESLPFDELRRSERRSYRCNHLIVHLLAEHLNLQAGFRVPARNISSSGLAFLHGQVLLINKQLEIQTPFGGGRVLRLLARVVRCRHVQGMIHEVAVQFISSRDGFLTTPLERQIARP